MNKRIARTLGSIGAVSGLMVGAVAMATPAAAADTASVDLADVSEIQSAESTVDFVDTYGETFSISVTTTWQRQSATQASLRSIVVRPVSFPRGDCISLNVGSTSNIGFDSTGRTLCPTGLLTYAPNAEVTAYDGSTTLGQLTFSAPDPGDPFGGGARWMYIEYAS